jgi:hypothetical protein
MNTWLPVLTVWLPGPGDAHVTDRAGIAIPEPPLIDVLDDPDIAPAAPAVLADDFAEPQPALPPPPSPPAGSERAAVFAHLAA